MSAAARAWLPESALDLDRARRAFAGPLAAWSDAWFTDAAATLSAFSHGDRAMAAPAAILPGEDGVSDVVLPARGKRLLAEAALSIDLAELNLGPNDHALIDAMTSEIALDLLERLGLAGADAATDETRMSLTVSLGGRDVLTARVPRSTIIDRLRAQLGKGSPHASQLIPRRRAIEPTLVMLDAVVGSGSLSLSELDALAPGDIVLLDEEVEAGIGLRVADSAIIVARGKLGRDDAKPALYL